MENLYANGASGCEYEVYSKKDAETKFDEIQEKFDNLVPMILSKKPKTDFKVLSATVSKIGIINFSYPEYFTQTNCVVVSIMYAPSGNAFKTFIGDTGDHLTISVGFGASAINVTNNLISSGTIKIVLMKYNTDDVS